MLNDSGTDEDGRPPNMNVRIKLQIFGEDNDSLKELLRKMSKWDAYERPSATVVLASEFFKKERLY